jgi:hypothetical protein
MDGINELAKLFKERENPQQFGINTGKVVSLSPLKVAFGESIILEGDNLVVSASACYEYVLGAETVQQKNKLSIGDEVILIPSIDIQKYYLIDKVVEV